MTTLQKIIKDAKSLRAKNPKKFSKWTDYVKEASKKYKSKSPVIKKKGTKKKVGVLKPNDKHKDTKSHNVNIRVVSGVKKKKAAKKTVKRSNTLTKVKQVLKQDKKRLKHGYTLTPGNVKIGVIKKMEMDQYHQTLKKIDVLERSLLNNSMALKQSKSVELKKIYKNQIDQIKKYLKELKIQKSELKKLL
jgi:dsDNA-binding SOS-regulon protein